MTVTTVHQDPDTLTMTITAQFDAPVERVWQLWADPRQLEQWWGPPTYPATVEDHDLSPGGSVKYFMTGPDGDRSHGWWRVLVADAPRTLQFEDGFADEAGGPNRDMPTMIISVTLAEAGRGGTSMGVETRFPSSETMEQMVSMGMAEGMSAAVGQIDEILGADVANQ